MSEKPKRLTVHRLLRPIRLAFLVRHDDRAGLLRALEINTCRWVDTGAGQPLPADHELADLRNETDQRVLANLLQLNQNRSKL